MISDWLELDATDDWVRHDAEIVCFAIAPLCYRLFLFFRR